MTVNNLIITRHQRSWTTDERDHLHFLLKNAISPRKRLLKAILTFFVVWGGALLGMLLASGVLHYLSQYSEMLSAILVFSGLKILVIVGAALYGLLSSYQWLKSTENAYPVILKDINEQEVVEEIYRVKAACRFQEPEMGGFIYLLKIAEQASFIIYDYQSQNTEKNSPFLIQENLILSRSLHGHYHLSYGFTGNIIDISETYPVTLPPEKWPQAETWLLISWSQIKTVFCKKT